jgi:DNA-binding HxlR family transcriptional regulator
MAKAAKAKVAGGCKMGDLLRLLGKAHVLDILYVFHNETGPKRFVELQGTLGMSPNTLSDRLRELVEAGILTRTAYNEIPPRVDYEVTAKARDLDPVFVALVEWARRHTLRAEDAPEKAAA